MDIEKIKSILDAIKNTDIEEIWLEKNGEKSGFRRKSVSFTPSSFTPSEKIVIEVPKSDDEELIQSTSSSKNQIKSSMVGTFLRSTTPGGKPLVKEGDSITIGQKICIIEAMKVMKEITSEVAGIITNVLVTDNHPVEYGQPLFELKTDTK
ncbi:MAG: biotin/lipoyl-containing protein [Elusimicrobiota bacterium]